MIRGPHHLPGRAWLLLGLLLLSACLARAQPPSIEQLFQRPRIAHIALSPDGKHVAMSLRGTERNAIAVYELAERRFKVVARSSSEDYIEPHWVDGQRLMFKSWDYQSTLSNNRAGGLYAVNLDGSAWRELSPSVAASQARGEPNWRPLSYVGPGPDGEVLLSQDDEAAGPDRFPGSELYRVDTRSGKKQRLSTDNPGEVQHWVVDRQGRARAAWVWRADRASGKLKQQTYYRESPDAAWQLLSENLFDRPGFAPAALDAEGRLYVYGREQEDSSGLYLWDFARQRPGKLLYRHPHFDLDSFNGRFFLNDEGLPGGVLLQAERPERHFFDLAMAERQALVDAALPGASNQLQTAGDSSLVISSSDRNPGSIFRYDAKARKLEHLFDYMNELGPGQLAAKQTIRYPAGDGRQIMAYLTLPPQRARPASGWPLVVFPHGGPAERNLWGSYWEEYEPFVQMLATRGYAVLQPQYRGSTGLGWQLYHAGWKQWDGRSVDDLKDGLEHLLLQRLVDPKRVCTLGKSSAGHTALYALIKYPDAFRCGISWAGTTDFGLFFSEPRAAYAGSAWLNYMAPWTHVAPGDKELIQRASVVANAARLRQPVLLAYGSADRIVPLVHGERLRDALSAAGRAPNWRTYADEGHGWALERNRVDFARAIEHFLATHLAKPTPPAEGATDSQDHEGHP